MRISKPAAQYASKVRVQKVEANETFGEYDVALAFEAGMRAQKAFDRATEPVKKKGPST